MLKNLLGLIALVILFPCAYAQIPPGYYDSAEGLTGDALKDALNDIIDLHIEYPYSSSSTDTWDILKVTDADPNNTSNVLGIYSEFSMNGAQEYNSGNGWNREHVWAKSRGDFGTSEGAGTDIHHLRAADISTNSARSNRNFDESNDQYEDFGGSYAGLTNAYTSNSDWTWEPPHHLKGDIARMLFYMATRYEGERAKDPDLELTESLLTQADDSPLHGKLSTLIDWHLIDGVSQEERDRNDLVYDYQGNRNPFIDRPEFVDRIWGSITILPVEIVAFEGELVQNNASLVWYTANADNVSHFEVQASENGQDFQSIGEVEFLNDTHKYHFVDALFNNQRTYRLKTFDFDGTSEFSQLLYLSNSLNEVDVYVVANQHINITIPENQRAHLTIYSVGGSVVQQQPIETKNTKIALANFQRGTYILEVVINGKRLTHTVIK